MSFDTFDTDSVATAGITFSNGNLTALGGSGFGLVGAGGIAQSVEGKTSGKWYVEFTSVVASGNEDIVGLFASHGDMPNWLGGATSSVAINQNGWGYITDNRIFNHGTSQTAVNNASWTTGDVIGLAIDLDNKRLWFRKNTGSWIGTSGTPDPATNTNGFDLTTVLANSCRVYPAVQLSGSTSKYTANFGATSFTGTVPSGFTSGWTNTTAGTYFGTFANTGKSAQIQNTPALNNKFVSKYTATFTGAVASITIPFPTYGHVKGVIYDSTGVGGLPGALLGVSSNTFSGSGSTNGELTFNFSGVSVTNGTAYWFGVTGDSGSGQSANWCPPGTGLSAFNSDTFASPSNPFGASPSTSNFRMPVIITAGSSTETGTGTLAFGGIAYSGTGDRQETGTGALHFGGIAFSASGSREESGAGALHFGGIAFSGAGAGAHTGTGALHFGGLAIQASGINLGVSGSGLRQFWTF